MPKKALIIIDMQKDYFPGGKWALDGIEAASAKAAAVLEAARAAGDLVVHVRHEFEAPDAPFFLAGSEGAEIHDRVRPEGREAVVLKHQVNAFRDTDLKEILDRNGIEDLVICGAMSHMCIDAATRAAADLGHRVTLIHDACATRDLDFNGVTVPAAQAHAAFMSPLGFAYATLVSADAYLGTVDVRAAVEAASGKWRDAFNAGDAAACAAAYEDDAVMIAKPFGTFSGRDEIRGFWEKIIADGFAAVEYLEPQIEVLDPTSAVLSANWRMNNAHGVITKELWVLQEDGTALLREDAFEVTG